MRTLLLVLSLYLAVSAVLAARSQVKVAIVGAGAAGISAANYFHEQGMHDFVLLEARERIGGRLHSVEFQGHTVDLGGAWYQGTTKSYLWELKEKYNMPCYYTDFLDMYTFYPNGTLVPNTTVTEYVNLADEMYTRVEEIAEEMGEKFELDRSLLSVIEEIGFLNDTMADNDYALRNWMLWFYFGWAYGEQLKGVGIRSMFDEMGPHDDFGNEDCLNLNGFQNLFIKVASPFKEKIKFNSTVVSVNYTGSLVEIKLNNSDTIEAEKVIITIPDHLMLVEKSVEFDPPLPHMFPLLASFSKRAQYMKVFLHFPFHFWRDLSDREFFAYAHPVEGYFPSFQNLDKTGLLPGSRILVATITGDEGKRLANLTDSEIQDEIMDVLRTMFPDAPDPDDFLRNTWYEDEYSRSVWSGTNINAYPTLRRSFLVPVQEKLYFAGEWAADKYNGYVHGAMYTGIEQAQAIYSCMTSENSAASNSRSSLWSWGKTLCDAVAV